MAGTSTNSGGESLHPPVDGDVIDLDTAFGEELFDVPVRQSVPQVPPDRDEIISGWNRKPAKTELVPDAATQPVSRIDQRNSAASPAVGRWPGPTPPPRRSSAPADRPGSVCGDRHGPRAAGVAGQLRRLVAGGQVPHPHLALFTPPLTARDPSAVTATDDIGSRMPPTLMPMHQ